MIIKRKRDAEIARLNQIIADLTPPYQTANDAHMIFLAHQHELQQLKTKLAYEVMQRLRKVLFE